MKNIGKMRFSYFFGFLLIALLLGLAEYLEVYKAMVPCPLCLLQRFVLMTLGVIFCIGMLTRFKRVGQVILGFLSLVICVSGILLSGRQVWLQHVPKESLGECGVSLNYLFQALPFMDALKQVWIGGMECSEQGWMFFHLSLAEWSLLGFLGFFVLVTVQLKRALNV